MYFQSQNKDVLAWFCMDSNHLSNLQSQCKKFSSWAADRFFPAPELRFRKNIGIQRFRLAKKAKCIEGGRDGLWKIYRGREIRWLVGVVCKWQMHGADGTTLQRWLNFQVQPVSKISGTGPYLTMLFWRVEFPYMRLTYSLRTAYMGES